MRKKIKFLIAVLAALFTLNTAHADVEDWYAYWSLGLSGGVSYPSKMDRDMGEMESVDGVERSQVNMDMLGFYWPLEDGQTMIGFVINGVSDGLSDGDVTFSVNQYLYGFSAIKFYGKEIGDGFFIRGDAGLARAVVDLDGTDGCDFTEESDFGIGMLVGIGYGLPVSSESRWMFGLNYSYKSIDFPDDVDNYASGAYGSFQLSVGGLW